MTYCRPSFGAHFHAACFAKCRNLRGPCVASLVAGEESDEDLYTPIREQLLEEYSEMGTFMLKGEHNRNKGSVGRDGAFWVLAGDILRRFLLAWDMGDFLEIYRERRKGRNRGKDHL